LIFRLWHNITEKLEQLSKAKEFEPKGTAEDLLQFYSTVVVKFEQRLNLVRLALVVVSIASKVEGE